MSTVFVGKNNSKKISELKPRDVITYHQDHSWLPVAQYDSRIDSYTNFAINISALTSYTNTYAYNTANEAGSYVAYAYNLDEWEKFRDIGKVENLGYITYELNDVITYSYIAQNLITYAFSYTDEIHNWQYLFGRYDVVIPKRPEYIYTELEEYINTEDGRKLTI